MLRSPSGVPLTFWATSRYRASSMCCVQLDSLLVHLFFSRAFVLLQLFSCDTNKGIAWRSKVQESCLNQGNRLNRIVWAYVHVGRNDIYDARQEDEPGSQKHHEGDATSVMKTPKKRERASWTRRTSAARTTQPNPNSGGPHSSLQKKSCPLLIASHPDTNLSGQGQSAPRIQPQPVFPV